MEFALSFSTADAQIEMNIDVNALIKKTDLIDYYHRIPDRLSLTAYTPGKMFSKSYPTNEALKSVLKC